MAITRVQGATANGGVIFLTGCAAANFLSLQSSWFDNASPNTENTPTDSNGTYSVGLAPTAADFGGLAIGTGNFFMANIAAGSHSTTPQTKTDPRRTLTEWAGVSTVTPKDVTAVSSVANTNHTAQATSSTSATAVSPSLALAQMALTASPGATTVGFTNPVTNYSTLQISSDDATSIGMMHIDQILAATGVQSATFNWTDASASQSSQASIVVYKGASGGAAATNRIFFPYVADGLGGGVVGGNRVH